LDKEVRMNLKRHTAEHIVGMLRQVEVELPGEKGSTRFVETWERAPYYRSPTGYGGGLMVL
jgi:hypothetical protein